MNFEHYCKQCGNHIEFEYGKLQHIVVFVTKKLNAKIPFQATQETQELHSLRPCIN